MELVKADIYSCDLVPRHRYKKTKNDNEDNVDFDSFILKNDGELLKEMFLLNHNVVSCHNVDKLKSAIDTENAFDEFEQVKIAYPTFLHESQPYYTECLMVEKFKDNVIDVWFLKLNRHGQIAPLTKGATSKKKNFVETVQKFDAIIRNSYLKEYDINYKFAVLSDYSDELEYITFARKERGWLMRDPMYMSGRDKEEMKPIFMPNIVDDNTKPLEIDSAKHINRKCAKCDYRTNCAFKECSNELLITDLSGNDWRNIDNYIKEYKTFSIDNLVDTPLPIDTKEKKKLSKVDKCSNINNYTPISQALYELHKNGWEHIINYPKLLEFLELLNVPKVQHLDFEGILSAFKKDKFNKLMHIPFSYSMHTTNEINQIIDHTFHMVDPSQNSFDSIVEHMLKHLDPNAPIVVYNKTYEGERFKDVARLYPQYEDFFLSLESNMIDLWDVFKNAWYYHSKMQGSGLKTTYKALCGDGYDELDINNGQDASFVYKEMFDDNVKDDEKLEKIKEYNVQDTLAQVEIVEELIGLTVIEFVNSIKGDF